MGAGELIVDTGLPDEAAAIVTAYLSRLDELLPLPTAERERIVIEVADALVSAIEARGCARERSAAAAMEVVAEFGEPAVLAEQFAAALAPAAARRAGLMLILGGPLVGLAWVAAIGNGAGLMARIGSTLSAMPVLPVILLFTVPAAVVAVLAGLNRPHLDSLAEAAPRAARWAVRGCLCADSLLLVWITAQVASGGLGVSGWMAGAVGLSAVRLVLAATALRRLTRLRAAVG